MIEPGTLYGIGVGPGDPELITLKAWRLLSTVEVIAYPRTAGQATSARAIAAPFIPEDVVEIPCDIPMCANPQPARAAYERAADRLAQELEVGRDAAFLCAGDPLFYGSFMYLFARLSGSHDVRVVPGVSALGACAASAGMPLAGRNDVLKVLPATLADEMLETELDSADALVFIKVGRNATRLKALLARHGLLERAVLVSSATGDDEIVAPLATARLDPPAYFTTVLVYKGGQSW